MKCEVLFKSVFFTYFFHKIVQRNVKLTREIFNLDSNQTPSIAQSIKEDIDKAAQTTAKLVVSPVVVT